MDLLARLAAGLGRFSQRWVPSAFSIAILLTATTAVMALLLTGATPAAVLRSWGDGFWALLAFAMRMALVMFSGYMVAVSPAVASALGKLAEIPRTPRQATAFMALASMTLGLFNWGLSIVGSAVLVRHVAARRFAGGAKVDYPLLVACAYFGLGATWHAGLSASAPLIAATASEPLTQQFGVVTIDRTLFSSFNGWMIVATFGILGALAWVLHPAPKDTVAIDPEKLRSLSSYKPPEPPQERTVATWIDHSRVLNVLLGGGGVAYASWRLWESGWRGLDIDLVNLGFLSLAVLLHRTPAGVVAAAQEAGSVLSGIVLQFPLYAGIYGIFQGTGLTELFAELFRSIATPGTLPLLVYWYSGLVNYFVPSGGAKWAIEAPYIFSAAQQLGVDPARMILAYSWGDMATNLIQPFWALPLLAVAKLDFKDILGYLALACLLYVGFASVFFLVFL